MAEVQFFGNAPAPSGTTANTIAYIVPNAPTAINVDVEFFRPPHVEPLSLNPSKNDLVYLVTQSVNTRTLEVQLVNASNTGLVAPQLDLVAGPLAPSGIMGKIARFIAPTGGTPEAPARTPMMGATMLIAGQTGGNRIVFDSALPVTPTLTDRLVITSIDRALRRTPVAEIILE